MITGVSLSDSFGGTLVFKKTPQKKIIMKLSKKKEEQLYSLIHEEIMKSRLEVAKLSNLTGSYGFQKVDEILYRLTINAPQKAVDLFKTKK